MMDPQLDDATHTDSDDSLKFLSQETYAQLVDCLKRDTGAEYTKIIDHPGIYTYESTDNATSSKCEISIETFMPRRSAAEIQTLQGFPGTQYGCPQFSTYSGQVPDDQHNVQQHNMTYPDSGTAILRPPTSLSPSPMSMIPSNQSFPGGYNFQFEFGKQPKDTKSTAWTYSATTTKLYAQKDALCPIKFSIDGDGVAHRLYLRALPVYSRPEYLQDVVKRCPNHVQAAESANIPHREHFIWCENQGATYVRDPHSGRYAVVVPYDAPPAGTPWVTYLFAFKCLNSCVGGPNRREMSIIYTLENANQEVLGRVCIELRICACPGRDRKSEENKVDNIRLKNQSASPATHPTTTAAAATATASTPTAAAAATTHTSQGSQCMGTNSHIVHERELLAVTKRARHDFPAEVFTLSIRGRRNFELLSKIRDSLEMTEQLVPDVERDRFTQQRRRNDNQHRPMATGFSQATAPSHPQHLPQMSSFNFSAARPFSIKQDVVDSTQRGIDMTDTAAVVAPSQGFDMVDSSVSTAPTVADWLRSIRLSAYIDNFHNAGLHSMDQLKSEQNFTIKDLESMKLTKPTVTQIWNSLKGFRLAVNPTESRTTSHTADTVTLPDSQGSSPPSSQESGGSQSQQSQRSAVSLASSGSFNPSLFEFTRCSLKLTVKRKRDN